LYAASGPGVAALSVPYPLLCALAWPTLSFALTISAFNLLGLTLAIVSSGTLSRVLEVPLDWSVCESSRHSNSYSRSFGAFASL
jgi:hypothetical protein